MEETKWIVIKDEDKAGAYVVSPEGERTAHVRIGVNVSMIKAIAICNALNYFLKPETKMKTDKSNEPAFPAMDMNQHQGIDRLELRYEGLTKREYFAAMAMQGLCVNNVVGSHRMPANLAREAIEYADELLKQLNPS